MPLLYRMASRGWLCISANYRLSPAASFPGHLIDVKKVLAWVRPRRRVRRCPRGGVRRWGLRRCLAGGLRSTYPQPCRVPARIRAGGTSVTGAICLYGYYGRLDGTNPESSPLAHLNADAPPFLVIHGDRDPVTPVDGARQFADKLRRVSGQPVVYAQIPGAQHTFDYFHSIRCDLALDTIEGFTAYVRTSDRQVHAG